MTVCHAFLRGECFADPCPYSHVRVNALAETCPDFLKGYCPRGNLCKLRHVRARKPEGKVKAKTNAGAVLAREASGPATLQAFGALTLAL
jgi:hypothetical protein